MKLKKFKKYIRILISFVLLFIIFNLINPSEIIRSIEGINFWYIILALISYTIDRILMAFKWRLLLKAKGINVSLFTTVKIYYMSNFAGLILPATLGSDATKTFLISRENICANDAIASIIIERVIGLMALAVYVFLALSILFSLGITINIHFNTLFLIVTLFTLAGILGLVLSFNTELNQRIIRLLILIRKKHILPRLSETIRKLVLSYESYKTKKKTLFCFFLCTLLEILVGIFVYFSVAMSFQLNVSFLYFVGFVPLMMFFVRIPISINGLGLRESGAAYFLSLAGVSASIGFSVGVIEHLTLLIGILPGAIFYLFNKSLEKNEMPQREPNLSVKEDS